MEKQDYAKDFIKRVDSENYSGAYQLFNEHPSLIADLPSQETLSAYVDFVNKGMNGQAKEFREGVKRYSPGLEGTLRALDKLKVEDFPKFSGDTKEKLFEKVMERLDGEK